MTATPDLILHSARQLLTMAGSAPKRGPSQGDLGLIEDGAIAIGKGKIWAVGSSAQVLPLAGSRTRVLDAEGRVVLPGWVDAHTHALFAGDRVDEFDLRLHGATYLDIMAAGGGIMHTVRATRAASRASLLAETRRRLEGVLAHGTTTLEIKSGYGLNTATELAMFEAILELAEGPVDLVPTFLGAHAVPAEYRGKADAYSDLVADEMLPILKDRFGTRAQTRHGEVRICVDVFCDEGAFTLAQARRILTRARELGFALKIHADEFANLGGTELAAELGALSADHCMVTTRAQMREMNAAGVVAVLLPGTTFGLGKLDFADGRAFVEENVPVALGSDLNPGTCWCESMPLILAMATRYAKLTPAEALVAATINAAAACGLADRVGSLEPGKAADLLIVETGDYRDLCYRFGRNPIRTVIKAGELVIG